MRRFAKFVVTLLCLLAVASVIYRGWVQTAAANGRQDNGHADQDHRGVTP